MNLARPDRSERLDALAAEYALGTLPGRVAGAARDGSPATSHGVAAAIAGVGDAARRAGGRPAGRRAAAARLGPHRRAPAPRQRHRGRTGRRRHGGIASPSGETLTAAGFAAALALGIALFAQRPEPAQPLVAVLAGADGKPALIASARRTEPFLLVKAVGAAPVDPGKALELWMLPQGQPPRSLGVLPAGDVVRVPLAGPSDAALANIPALAVSLEPAGGSPTGLPTGPVLYSGKIERMY